MIQGCKNKSLGGDLLKFSNDVPIYIQLIDIFKDKILKAEWKADEKIPSVRGLAVSFGVNPNTVQRALTELEHAGYVRSERTLGRFVQSDIKSLKQLKVGEFEEVTNQYIKKMKSIGIRKEDVLDSITKKWEEL